MKTVINVILGVCAAVLAYICIGSIIDDQELDGRIEDRKSVVIARLLDVKKAQEAFKEMHDTVVYYQNAETEEMDSVKMGRYAESFAELEDFLRSGRYPEKIIKEGQIQEDVQRHGWTEEKVAHKIWELRNQGMSDAEIRTALDAEQLYGVWCDTVWTKSPVTAILGRADYPIDSLKYIPFSESYTGEAYVYENGEIKLVENKKEGVPAVWNFGERIEIKMEIPMHDVMECGADFKYFLSGMGKLCNRKIMNMTQYETGRGAYPGLKIGELAKDMWNNNAGNWE